MMRAMKIQAQNHSSIGNIMRVIDISKPLFDNPLSVPSPLSSVQAGFPSPAEDYIEKELDINALVIKHPAATFFVRVEGESMIDANIFSGDILVVDRSLTAVSGKIVIAIVDGDFTVKRFIQNQHQTYLSPENPKYPTIQIDTDTDFQIWGVVTHVIHKTT